MTKAFPQVHGVNWPNGRRDGWYSIQRSEAAFVCVWSVTAWMIILHGDGDIGGDTYIRCVERRSTDMKQSGSND